MNTFHAVGEFHRKFDLPTTSNTAPSFPTEDVLRFRLGFLIEELTELADACGMNHLADKLTELDAELKLPGSAVSAVCITMQNLEKAADALGDLKYVTDGTAHFMGIPFNEVFAEIQRANMAKERATGADDPRSTRPHALNVVKPDGWTAPNHEPILEKHAAAFRVGG